MNKIIILLLLSVTIVSSSTVFWEIENVGFVVELNVNLKESIFSWKNLNGKETIVIEKAKVTAYEIENPNTRYLKFDKKEGRFFGNQVLSQI